MGRKAGQLYLNPKRFASMNKPCMKEMISLLNCLSLNHLNDEKCARPKELLTTCMEAQVCTYGFLHNDKVKQRNSTLCKIYSLAYISWNLNIELHVLIYNNDPKPCCYLSLLFPS